MSASKSFETANRENFKFNYPLMEEYMLAMELLPGGTALLDIPNEIDFQTENGNPIVYLLKAISSFQPLFKDAANAANDENKNLKKVGLLAKYGPPNVAIGVAYEQNSDGTDQRFYIPGLKLQRQITSTNNSEAEDGLIEIAKAAVLLVKSAKAKGWTEVNFGKTTDPLKLLALEAACKAEGLKCPAIAIKDADFPQKTSFGSTADLKDNILQMVKKITSQPTEFPGEPVIKPANDTGIISAPRLVA